MKIVYLPLDERPCNYEFPYLLSKSAEVTLVRPDLSIMGNKKIAGNTDAISDWLEAETKDADGLILSIDTLLYGGIIPSRLHQLSVEEISIKLQLIEKLKQANAKLKIFAFHLIMRCPKYSSSDEEPDYYETYGESIFQSGYLGHKVELGIASEVEKDMLEAIHKQLPSEVLKDYLDRRHVNASANCELLSYVLSGIIDFVVIPQDDSAPYGYTAKDQQRVRRTIQALQVDMQALMYPGADEAGCTLLARMINEFQGSKPYIYPKYAGTLSASIIPLYEDRQLGESVKYQILAAGGHIATSAIEADMILLVNAPGDEMVEASSQHESHLSYQVHRNVIELVENGKYLMERFQKPVAVADVAYANGGDLQLLRLLRQREMLYEIAGYAGWNTSSNTLGTVIAQMMIYHIYGNTTSHRDFLALRYTEDCGYCACVRGEVTASTVNEMGYTYFGVDGVRGTIASVVQQRLEQFVAQYVNTDRELIQINDTYMPWNRMFEVGLSISVQYVE